MGGGGGSSSSFYLLFPSGSSFTCSLVAWGVRRGPARYLVHGAGPDRHHGGLQHLPLRLLRQHDAPLGDGFRHETLHQHAVEQREELPEGLQVRQTDVHAQTGSQSSNGRPVLKRGQTLPEQRVG